MPATHHMLCVWHINKNIQAQASKYFPKKEPCQAWMELWHKDCQVATLAEYNQARAELEIADPPLIAENRDSLFQYADREYLANGNNQKHCYFWTNGIRHFNKRVTSTAEGGHSNIKRALESTLGDLPEVVRVIREKIEDQLRKIRLQHSSDKNGNIRAFLNIGIFRYLRHEISEYALELIATHAKGVNATTVLPEYTSVFTKTLGLPSKYKIQESFRDPDHPLRQDDLHPHWWLNPLEDEKPVEPWARIQPPVQTRRRGRPRNPRRELSAFEIAAARAQNQVVGQDRVGRRGRNIREKSRGQGHDRGEAHARNLSREDQPRRAGLRRKTEPEERNSSNESQ